MDYAVITLIPKEPGAKVLNKFRPISLSNCSFKFFSMLLNNRMVKVSDRLVASNQTAFIKGRFILESAVAAHEIIHEVSKMKHEGVVLKLDYEQAYHRVSWFSLRRCLNLGVLVEDGEAGYDRWLEEVRSVFV
jgi:hypothetical protein